MRNIILLLACTLLALSTVNCGPIVTTNDETFVNIKKLDDGEKLENLEQLSTDTVRMPRLLCDIFSAEYKGISVANGLCLAKCASQRHLGGQCENGICVCSERSF